MPIVASLLLILAFILPAFIIYEPPESGETVGLKLAVVIGLAAFGIFAALFRIFGSWWQTRRLIDDWSANAVPIELWSIDLPAFRLRHPFPVFAVVGVVRPRLYIAQQLLDTLEPHEIRAVIRHEFGHIAAWDNLKRLAMKISGDILILPIGRLLDRAWSETAEKAADDFAVEHGSRSTAIDLASALIKIARLVPERPLPPMPAVSFVLRVDDSLSIRIRRLLSLVDRDRPVTNRFRFAVPIMVLAVMSIMILATDDKLLESVHELSESVLAFLQ